MRFWEKCGIYFVHIRIIILFTDTYATFLPFSVSCSMPMPFVALSWRLSYHPSGAVSHQTIWSLADKMYWTKSWQLENKTIPGCFDLGWFLWPLKRYSSSAKFLQSQTVVWWYYLGLYFRDKQRYNDDVPYQYRYKKKRSRLRAPPPSAGLPGQIGGSVVKYPKNDIPFNLTVEFFVYESGVLNHMKL